MKTSELIEILKRIQEDHGDIDILVLARDSGGDYNEYLPIEDVGIYKDIYDCSDKYHREVAVI